MITIQKVTVMFKVSPASLQTFIDARLTLTPSVIPNSNYVIMVSYRNCLKYFCLFLYCNHQVYRYSLITLYVDGFIAAVNTLIFAVAGNKRAHAVRTRFSSPPHPHGNWNRYNWLSNDDVDSAWIFHYGSWELDTTIPALCIFLLLPQRDRRRRYIASFLCNMGVACWVELRWRMWSKGTRSRYFKPL
jgi:hypothetical protein